MAYLLLLLILNSIAGILLLKSQQELIKNKKIALIELKEKNSFNLDLESDKP